MLRVLGSQAYSGTTLLNDANNYFAPAYLGESIMRAISTYDIEIDFGSDSHVQYPGVGISKIQVGSAGASPTESSTWGEIKSLFR